MPDPMMQPEPSTRAWELLAAQVDAFVETWEAGDEPPTLADYLPTDPRAPRSLTLVELIKVDLEYRWQRADGRKRIEQYMEDFPELTGEGRLPCDLIYEEYHIRKQAGDDPEPDEYFQRFPAQADELRRLLGLESPHMTTVLFSRDRPKDFEVGDSVDDFDLLTRLGKGAFGSVFLARQRSMQRLVALKISSNRGSEPQTMAQLDHPYIVRVYDQRVLPDRHLRLLYMQFVPAGTLHGVIAHARPIPQNARTGATLLDAVDRALDERGESPPTDSASRRALAASTWAEAVCRIGAQLAEALDHAHRQGVLHRDVKPANVLVAANATPKLADFNISFSSQLFGATPAAYLGGSLAYMSPEQLEACNPADARGADSLGPTSDVYSLAVLLWELLDGQRPFPEVKMDKGWSATLRQMADHRLAGPPSPPENVPNERCLEELTRVLCTCLAPEPERRFSSGSELARELRLCMQPRALNLLRIRDWSWRQLIRSAPTLAVLASALVPNALAGWFNYDYNLRSMIEDQSQRAQESFQTVVMAVNLTAFPLGLLVAAFLTRPVAQALRQARQNQPVDDQLLRRSREHTLRMGHLAAIIGIVLWVICGVIYPVSLDLLGAPLLGEDYFHFVISLAICGVIAAAYPFFAITYLAVHVFFPALLARGSPSPDEEADLARVGRRAGAYLVLGAVPMLAIGLLWISEGYDVAMGILSVTGFLGFGLLFYLYRAIQRDLAALAVVVLPTSDRLTGTGEAVDSFWSESRT